MNFFRYTFKRKALTCCMAGMLVLCAQWGYGQDIIDTVIAGPAAGTSQVSHADTATSHNAKALYIPVLRKVPDSVVVRLKASKDFAYANDPAYWQKKKEQPSGKGFWYYIIRFFSSDVTRTIFYVVLAGVLIFALYRVVLVNKLFMFYSPGRKKSGEEEALTEMSDENLDEKIRAAVTEKNYRMGVRYLYLKTLRSLHNKGWIAYHGQATNDDYLRQMSDYAHAAEFGFLTRVYDYVWYGGMEISEAQFVSVYDNFENFYRNTGA